MDTGNVISVESFNKEMGSLPDVKICTCAVAYDCPKTGETYLLLFHESLYIPGLQTHLLNPAQLRMQGITVDDVPLTLLPEELRTQEQHSILSWDPPLHITLELQGVMSGFTVREPTWEECNDLDQERVMFVHMTSSEPWDPHSETLYNLEGTL